MSASIPDTTPLAAEELASLPDSLLDERIRVLELERRRVESELSAAIDAADRRQLNSLDGHRSMAGYLRATCNWAPGEITRFRNAARLVGEHPDVRSAWSAGRIGAAQVTAISRVHSKAARTAAGDRFGEFVPLFVDQAETLPLADLEIVLQRFVALADGDGTISERSAVQARRATADHVDGTLHLVASGGDATTTATFLEIVQRFADAEFRKDCAAIDAAEAAGLVPPVMRTGPQRRFDALMTMARIAHGAVASGDETALETLGSTPPAAWNEPLVSVLTDQRTMSWVLAHSGLGATEAFDNNSIDPFTGLPTPADVLADLLGDPDTFLSRRCETTSGIPLRPTDVLRAALSGHIRRAVLGAKSRPIDLGRSSRVFTGAARDAALLLATTCEHPGCDMPAAWCQIDHSTEWHDDGRTDQNNAGTECQFHNHDKHTARRRTRRADNGRTYTFRPDGTIMLPVGVRPPRFSPPPDDDADSHDVVADAADDECTPERHRLLREIACARIRKFHLDVA